MAWFEFPPAEIISWSLHQHTSLQLTPATKTGNDECEEGEKERRRRSEVWDLDSLVHLVSEEDEEDQERHHEEAVAQGRVSGRPRYDMRGEL